VHYDEKQEDHQWKLLVVACCNEEEDHQSGLLVLWCCYNEEKEDHQSGLLVLALLLQLKKRRSSRSTYFVVGEGDW
jgi:hypothetical protein